MGLVSYLKDLYYNSRLDKAISLLQERKYLEAEQILLSLLDKHPMAVATLAGYYYSSMKSADVITTVSLIKKIVSLENKGDSLYDAKAYGDVVKKLVNDVICKAKGLFASSYYLDCSTLLSTIKETKYVNEEVLNLCCFSDINILLQKIEKTNVSDIGYDSLITNLRQLLCRGTSIPNVQETIIIFCNKLCIYKRFYASALLLGVLYGNYFHDDCLQKIAMVIKGEDVEVTPKIIRDVVAKYGRHLMLRNNIDRSESVALFEKCWQQSEDCNFVINTLTIEVSIELRNDIITNIIGNPKTYLSNLELLNQFTKWICDTFEFLKSIELLEKIHDKGYNVEACYVAKVHTQQLSLSHDTKILLLNRARTFYPKSKILLSDILECAKWYEKNGQNTSAIQIADSIISDSDEAKLVKSKALCNLGNNEKDLDKKRQYIEQAFAVLGKSEIVGIIDVRNNLQKSYLDIAELYYSSGKIDDFYTILRVLINQKYEKALLSLVSHYFSTVSKCSDIHEKLKKVDEAINEINSYKISSVVKYPEYCSLWSEKVNTTIDICRTKDNESAIAEFEKLIYSINAVGFDNVYAESKCTLLQNNIIERKYNIAKELEKDNKLNEAATAYKEINALEKKRVPTLSALRFILCKLKLGDISEVLQNKDKIYSLLKNAAQVFKAEKDDIAYRFSLALLKAGEDKEALSILIDYLPNEIQLRKACEQGAMIKAQTKLDDFNQKLEAVKNKTLSSDDAVYFINHMLEYAEIIKPLLELSRAKLSKYRVKLKNYAIFKLFDEGKFDVAFEKMIKEHSDYLEDLTALRNIALICLNIAEAKQLKKSNYKEVISVWLTAIYQERLFVKSLDYTSWDDQYQFTLQNAYGHYDESYYEDLPDNVSFADPVENVVISIREVQRNLLDRFETAITDNQEHHEFFTAQRDAMDALIKLSLDNKCTLVAPFLASNNENIFDGISTVLEAELKCKYGNWEDVIFVGLLYNLKGKIYNDYRETKDLFRSLKTAIENKNNVRLFTSSNIDKIRRFDKVYSSFISFVGSRISALKCESISCLQLDFDFYNEVCASIKDSTISFTFSNQIMHYIVSEVNESRMKCCEASKYILSLFMLDITNERVKDNLTTLFQMLLVEGTLEASKAVDSILSKVKDVDSKFHRMLKTEHDEFKINKELNDIVEKVNTSMMSESQALSKVYALYSNNLNNPRVCENLVHLCNICIMKYVINNERGSITVSGILDKIYNNMSYEFKKHKNMFVQSYNQIWGRLPFSAKSAIEGRNPGVILNEEGEALKRGLGYYKKFGGLI